MLRLEHFYHLSQLDPLIEQIVSDGPGLIVVAGLNPRQPSSLPASSASDRFLPSGRSTIFRILLREILLVHPTSRAVVVAENKDAVRIPRQLRRRILLSLIEGPQDSYARRIAAARSLRPGLLAIDRLCPENIAEALAAARSGFRVLSQLDTVFRGSDVVRHMLDLGASEGGLAGLAWIVAVQRLATLCPRCKEAAQPDPAQLDRLRYLYPGWDASAEVTFYRAPGCDDCHHTGRKGDVACFDVFRADAQAPDAFDPPSLLPMEEYALGLAMQGTLSLNDVLRLDVDQLRRTYNLLAKRERALAEANTALMGKLAQLEAAHRVLQQRSEALHSFRGMSQALISPIDLGHLADRVCRHARDLCGADRAVLYYLHEDDRAEVLAVSGWSSTLLDRYLEPSALSGFHAVGNEPEPFNRVPPGVASRAPELRAGLRVPLVAQDRRVGLMIVHATDKARFRPGEVAMLQTFAQQAALAIQRAGLVESLRNKIAELEAAQAELAQKERLERELELARQVQQSVLPRVFPLSADYSFAAYNEPARRVGGDFYDVILLDADRFGLVIGDVSDKGMPAALYMALTRSLLLAEARAWSAPALPRSPLTVLTNVNRLLRELGEPNMFVSVFYGILEGGSRRLTYTRAGHDRPLLLRDGTVQTLGGTGACLGILEQDDLHLSEEQAVLSPGDRLVLYTDGLTDVMSPGKRLFGLGRFRSLLRSYARLLPEDLCKVAFADLAAYQGDADQFDDMTMLIVGVK
jgi:sigma-B regulation protein RsbU (phosphoserine phosphatase)